MPELRILPGNVANMIAAGEVVQRPASVVKELMENSLDAGARSVSVVATDAGRTLLQVIDDGCGMSADDAVLCFERHATSKIATAEDLEHIMTFGFRGEALASIAAVAEVTLRTRRPEDEVGTEVVFAASKLVSQEEVAVLQYACAPQVPQVRQRRVQAYRRGVHPDSHHPSGRFLHPLAQRPGHLRAQARQVP